MRRHCGRRAWLLGGWGILGRSNTLGSCPLRPCFLAWRRGITQALFPAKRMRHWKSASATTFDEAHTPALFTFDKTSVVDPAQYGAVGHLCVQLPQIPARAGSKCARRGLWHWPVEGHRRGHFPGAAYQGVEFSPYLCERFGWRQQGSVVDHVADAPFDLVICQGVLPYLRLPDLKRALHNLGTLSKGGRAVCRGRLARGL